jgi:hypothetical protein
MIDYAEKRSESMKVHELSKAEQACLKCSFVGKGRDSQ